MVPRAAEQALAERNGKLVIAPSIASDPACRKAEKRAIGFDRAKAMRVGAGTTRSEIVTAASFRT